MTAKLLIVIALDAGLMAGIICGLLLIVALWTRRQNMGE